MSTFGYPILSRGDVISMLAESQIAAVTDNDFKNIKPSFVSDLYTRLLIYLDALHEEGQGQGQIEFSALEQFESPDLLIGSIQVMNLYCKLREVMASLNCPIQFTLRDLVKPDPGRTEHFLSGILNFCLFKETKMNLQRPIMEELALLDEQRKEWEAKISQFNAEIAGYSDARERELPFVQEVNSKVKELCEMIAGLNGNQMSFRTSFRNLTEKTLQIDEKISKAEFDLVQNVQENANLCSKIVHSPDKLQRALEEKKLARDEAMNAERLAMQSFLEKTATVEVYSKPLLQVLEKRSKHFALIQAIHEQLEVEFKRCELEARQKKVEDVVAEVDSITLKTSIIKESGAAKMQQVFY
ncbi:probable kinetochore protein NUF2 isoform X2 [Durio zibethinus]|uniref:Probable kinetochore protein NUF2 isoform X2 n=1 Tax=Durio zibethinus TaxID=66656 RepID=A0A6P5YPC3_DURZI|nr:probable kinetochore protein NUF2 isoform X2 [Durio zibethinus]